jgi:16S rRNA G966 N2-methylase RsmD
MSEQEPSKAISIRVKHTQRSKYNNQRRHDLRVGHQPNYVDTDLSVLNRVLIDPPYPAMIAAKAKQLRKRTPPIL